MVCWFSCKHVALLNSGTEESVNCFWSEAFDKILVALKTAKHIVLFFYINEISKALVLYLMDQLTGRTLLLLY
ncbi:hypothetical protein AN642_00330 [Epulopiscium sp. SCG-B10WGA-EpuloA2]|nr:hypothetical protein AN642_00315 [Epulopiscium sp. SCG-B10WGA-EpuloA2]ONI44773.1 hypothetical protein AN642_00330 [Epulopiscium sp. SCG-B10WGA-EpuloA2]